MRQIRLPVLLGLVLVATSVPVIADAAEPAAGSVGPDNPKLTWDGQFYDAARTFFGPDHCPLELDPDSTLCDHFTLTVDVEPSYWRTHEGGVWVTINFGSHDDDFDLHIYQEGKVVASSVVRVGTMEQVLMANASGSYEVRVTPEDVQGSGYLGSARFVSRPRRHARSPNQAYHGVRIMGVNPDQEPQSTPTRYRGAPLVLQTVDVGRNAGEPTIGIDPTGVAFYAAVARDGTTTPLAGQPRTRLLRSTDGGLTWHDVSPVLDPGGVAYHQFTGDPHMYLDGDSGRVFFLDWLAPMAPIPPSEISITDDQGESFETVVVADLTGGNDRPTLTSGPIPKDVPLTPLDPAFEEIVYLCVNNVSHSNCSRSLDGGRTFTPTGAPPFVGVSEETGGAPCSGIMGDPQTDPEGRLIVPKVRCVSTDPQTILLPEVPWISVSEDAGATWDRAVVSETIRSYGLFSQVAADAAGNLFYVWWDRKHRLPYLATSTDQGQTWSDPLMIAPPGVHEVSLVTIAAGDRGRIAVTFPGTTSTHEEDPSRAWNSYIVISTNALDEDPLFVSARANPASDPIHRGDCEEKCAGMLDFLDIQVSSFDGSMWAAVVDTCTRIERCSTEARPGHDFGTGEPGVAVDSRGIAIRQLSGPWLVRQKAPSATYSSGGPRM